MASLGCLVGEQDGRHVTVRGGFVELDGDLVDDIPLAELDRRINCPVCREQLLPYRRGSGRFLRHRQGEAHPDPVLNYAGESNRHYALKHYVTDVYVASKTWGARAEDWTDSRTRRPDVTCWPKPGRSRSTAGVDHTKTAYEIQLVDISDADVERRTFDHKADGVPVTFWLEGRDEPRQRPNVAASAAITRVDQVIGVAQNADVDWRSRDWLPEMDLDRFCAEHRRGLIVWQSDYGVLTTEAWLNHLRAGGVDVDRRKRSAMKAVERRAIAVHRSVHGGAEEVFDEAMTAGTAIELGSDRPAGALVDVRRGAPAAAQVDEVNVVAFMNRPNRCRCENCMSVLESFNRRHQSPAHR